MKNRVLGEKSFAFAVRIVNLARYLNSKRQEHTLSKQLLRSGTAIGALIREGFYAESELDMIHKYSVARKEAFETLYWIELLTATQYLFPSESATLHEECTELLKMLTASIKSLKGLPKNNP